MFYLACYAQASVRETVGYFISTYGPSYVAEFQNRKMVLDHVKLSVAWAAGVVKGHKRDQPLCYEPYSEACTTDAKAVKSQLRASFADDVKYWADKGNMEMVHHCAGSSYECYLDDMYDDDGNPIDPPDEPDMGYLKDVFEYNVVREINTYSDLEKHYGEKYDPWICAHITRVYVPSTAKRFFLAYYETGAQSDQFWGLSHGDTVSTISKQDAIEKLKSRHHNEFGYNVKVVRIVVQVRLTWTNMVALKLCLSKYVQGLKARLYAPGGRVCKRLRESFEENVTKCSLFQV